MKRQNEQQWQIDNQGKKKPIGTKIFQLGANQQTHRELNNSVQELNRSGRRNSPFKTTQII